MKIKKYTIDDDIPEGAVFMESKLEQSMPERVMNTAGGGAGGMSIPVKYFYFLVLNEEKEVEPTHILLKCPH